MSELPRKAQDRINTFGVVLIGVVATVLLWVSVVALQAYYYSTAGEVESQRASAGKSREARDLKAQQRADLQDSKYIDPKKGIVTIPLDDAMKLVLQDAKTGARSLVPAIGAHDQPTIPAVSGRPPDNVATTAAPGGAAAPAGGAAPPAGGATPPAGGATPPDGTTPPASGSAPATPAPDAKAAPAAPAPATPPTTTPTPPSPPPNP